MQAMAALKCAKCNRHYHVRSLSFFVLSLSIVRRSRALLCTNGADDGAHAIGGLQHRSGYEMIGVWP